MFEKLQADYRRFLEIEQAMLDPTVTADSARVTTLSRERGKIAKVATLYGRYLDLGKQIDEAETLVDAEPDAAMRTYAEGEIATLRERREVDAESLRNLLYDRESGADRAALIMEIRAGAGGDEAALFARDLYEMYRRFAESMGWKFELLDMEATELAGFREVSFSVSGEGAFRLLQFESGGHRVQRVPQTEAQGRIHTSAATVAVLPEPEDVEIDIRTEDVRVDLMCSGGPGGQHQNKTESGVRLTHLPTGIVVNCRDERSQHKNKAKAYRVLRSRIYDLLQEQTRSKRDQARRSLIGSGDRSQRIRTYSYPQNRVTDHRIGLTLYNLDQVIQGDLLGLLKALVDHDRREQLGDL
ncbi:peptide chain release factor 1 [Paludisphaera mucosa]|uniref:Peptide chain release factor 1 n=1 Tax=Paludisphaera mucosa TaxID=3030827 RepID=A0ABT6FF59_9BACT|nr:peptide chain release factor 1 [Paludisphaera mucosa]